RLLALPLGSSVALAEDMKLPPLKKQPTPQAVIDEHMDALNKCDWSRLMAQYPADYQLNLPDGVVVKGREVAAKIFADFVKPHDQGGSCGIKFSPEQTLVVGEWPSGEPWGHLKDAAILATLRIGAEFSTASVAK